MNHPPIYTMTLEELEERALRGETLVTPTGHLICSRDRKYNRLHAHYFWSAAVDNAIYQGKLDPKDNPKGKDAPPNIKPKQEPVNAKGKTFSWSISALLDYEGCAYRYAQKRVWCNVVDRKTEATIWGNRVHKSGEIYVRDGVINDQESFKEVEKYAKVFRSLKDQGADVHPELEIVLDRNLNQVTGKGAWLSAAAWFRCKIDVPVVRQTECNIYDYKTGKNVKDDQDQLKICCAAHNIVRPEIEVYTPKLIWTRHQVVTGTSPEKLAKDDLTAVWADVLPRVARMEEAWKTGVFNARPSGLCKWKTGQCPAYEKCPYHR